MRCIIYGAGAIGMSLSALLIRAGINVVLIGRGENAKKIKKDGITLHLQEETYNTNVDIIEDISKIKTNSDDMLFITVKSQQLQSVLDKIITHIDSNIPIYCFQNGIRNELIVSNFFNNVYGVIVFYGAVYLNHGEVLITKQHPMGFLEIGKYPNGWDKNCDNLIDILKNIDFIVFKNNNIMKTRWGKLFVNLSNSIRAITGEEAVGSLAHKLVQAEAVQVLNKANIEYESGEEFAKRVKNITSHAVIKKPVKDLGSMWQSLMRGSPTEIDYFNGEIVNLGQKYGIATPINELLCNIIKSMEANSEKPGKHSLESLTAMIQSCKN